MTFKTDSLTHPVIQITCEKATEYPFTGKYHNFEQQGSYLCRQCGLALFRSDMKFHSGCGWPSFDDSIKNTVIESADADGQRTEILCSRCQAHLGHVFRGEHLTSKNTRHCVNSASLDFVSNLNVEDTEEAIFAGGCFWGVEYFFKKLAGVLKTEVGYTGGTQLHPSYQQVCSHQTGHVEAVRILYDPKIINYEALTKYFLEIHDPTQTDGQGPDIGSQYLSVIFYYNDLQKTIAEKLITTLKNQKYNVATKVLPVQAFWTAEDYHQDYYQKNNQQPYCHFYHKKFD